MYSSRPALDAVTLEIAAGSSVALIGPNGSGKTTLLHLVAGLIKPSSGSIRVHGGPSAVAYVLQRRQPHAWMPLTVAEVLAMGRYRHLGLLRRARPADRAAISAAVERLEVVDLLPRQFGELSGGQRQRVMVAQALALHKKLVERPRVDLDLIDVVTASNGWHAESASQR